MAAHTLPRVALGSRSLAAFARPATIAVAGRRALHWHAAAPAFGAPSSSLEPIRSTPASASKASPKSLLASRWSAPFASVAVAPLAPVTPAAGHPVGSAAAATPFAADGADASSPSALASGLVDDGAGALDPAAAEGLVSGGAEETFSTAAHLLLDHPFTLLPSPLPPYVTTIVLVTLALRLCVTLPATLWAHQREVRLREKAVPELKMYQNEAREALADGCRKERYPHAAYEALLSKRLKAANKLITDKHSAAALPTILVPLAVQVPLFFSLVYVLRAASVTPLSPLGAELLPVLGTSLAVPDETGMLPLTVGLLMWANTEFLARARLRKAELDPFAVDRQALTETVEQDDGKGGVEMVEVETKAGWLERQKTTIFKAAGIGFAAISIFAPACMQVYFITTYAFTLVQTLYLTQLDTRRQLGLRKALMANPPREYVIKVADLPKNMTFAPPLPAGAERISQTFTPRQTLRIPPVELAFDVKTGKNFPLKSTLKLKDPVAQAEAEAKAKAEEKAKGKGKTGGATRT